VKVVDQVALQHSVLLLDAAGAPTSRGHQQGAAAPTPARQDLHQDASRHRYRFAPPATPNGFWDMGFGDSQDSRI